MTWKQMNVWKTMVGAGKPNSPTLLHARTPFVEEYVNALLCKESKFSGDGYVHCEASGYGRCEINNGGCWKQSKDGRTYSACIDGDSSDCMCPLGFKGNGIDTCEDVDECKEKTACQCSGCKCTNTWGSYECSCSGDRFYMRRHDVCISKKSTDSWGFLWFIFLTLAAAAVGAYAVYKYRLRSYMDSEIRAIMAQYMPLDNQAAPNQVQRAGSNV